MSRWWTRTGFLNAAIGAFVVWFIRRAKGPDKTQRELIEEQRNGSEGDQ